MSSMVIRFCLLASECHMHSRISSRTCFIAAGTPGSKAAGRGPLASTSHQGQVLKIYVICNHSVGLGQFSASSVTGWRPEVCAQSCWVGSGVPLSLKGPKGGDRRWLSWDWNTASTCGWGLGHILIKKNKNKNKETCRFLQPECGRANSNMPATHFYVKDKHWNSVGNIYIVKWIKNYQLENTEFISFFLF